MRIEQVLLYHGLRVLQGKRLWAAYETSGASSYKTQPGASDSFRNSVWGFSERRSEVESRFGGTSSLTTNATRI